VVAEVKPMDVKRTQQLAASATKDKSFSLKQVVEFVGDIKAEFKKISWTSYEELMAYTKIVVGATFFFGLGIYVVDLFIQGFLTSLSGLIRLISG